MKNELKIGSALSILTIIVGSLIQIFYTPLYMKYLGTTDFGINSLVQSIMGYIGMLNLGLGNAMLRYTVRYRAEGKKEEEKSLNGMFLTIFSILMLVSVVIGIYIYSNISNFFSDKFTIEELSKTKSVFLLMMLNVAISFPVGVFSTNIASREKFLYQKGLSLIKTIITPIIGAILMLNGYGLIAITISVVTLGLFVSIFDIIYAKKLGMKINFKNFDLKVLKEIFHYSFYIFLNIIIDRVYWGTDRVIIGKYIGVTAVGIYSIASIFNQLYMNFSTAISGVLFPKINRLIVEDKHEEISNLFIKVGRLQYILLGLISSGFILFGKEFIYLWLGNGYLEVYKIALWIMIPLTVPLIQNTGIAIMQARNMHQFRSIVYFFIAVINVLASIFLVKKYGIIGCAIATGVSFIIGNIIIMNIYYYKRLDLNIPLFWKKIIQMSIPIGLAMGLGIGLNKYVVKVDYIHFILKIFIFTGVYFILLVSLGLNKSEKKEIYSLILKNKIIQDESKKNREIYYQGLRGIAILAVIIIHTLPIIKNEKIIVISRQFINFAVPLFLFLSGYFCKKQYERGRFDYKKSLLRVGIPYLIWSFIIIAKAKFYNFDFKNIILSLITVRHFGIYYYIILLIQLILLSPILLKIKLKLWLLLVTPISVLVFYYFENNGSGIEFPYNVLFFWSGITFYYLGIYYEEVSEKIIKNLNYKITFFCLVVVNILETFYLFKIKNNFSLAISQFKISSLMLTFILILFIIREKKFKKIFENKFLVILGDLSFGIYLMHALLIGPIIKSLQSLIVNQYVKFFLVTFFVIGFSVVFILSIKKILKAKSKYIGF